MNHLVYGHCGLSEPHFGVTMDCALELLRRDNQVYFPYCDGRYDLCLENQCGNRLVCRFCHLVRKSLMGDLPKGLVEIPLRKSAEVPQRVFEYHDLATLKRLRYRDVWIGYGVLSSYISATRDSRPSLDEDRTRRYFDHALSQIADMADWVHQFLDDHQIDEIHVFNGRLFDNRALYDIAVARGIPFRSHEVIGGFRTGEDFKHIVYPDGLPHNLKTNTQMAEWLWADAQVSGEEKTRIGTEFFRRRRNNQQAGDRVYTSRQCQGLLPDGFDSTKKNVVVFNSSEDEFAAIGKDFEDYQLFANQTEGIEFLLRSLPSGYHVYVRIHPNLTKIKYDYVSELFKLPDRYGNVSLIPPDSPVSTYALMDAADKVVVFGSTTGAEATFAGKVVILAGPAFYQFLDVAYTPSSAEEFAAMVGDETLRPKPKVNAVKYAYFLLERGRLAEKYSHVDLHICHLRFGPVTFRVSGYSKLFGSRLLKKLLQVIVVYGLRVLGRYPLPNPEMKEHSVMRSS